MAARLHAWIYPRSIAYAEDCLFTNSSITGSKFCGRTADFHAYPFSGLGYYEWRNLAVALAVSKPGDTILEIGANIGTETVGYRDLVGDTGRVIAVEPFPGNAERLEDLKTLNRWSNLTILRTAMAEHSGTLRFVSPPDRTATGVGHIQGDGESPTSPVFEVAVVALDALQMESGIVHAVFMDTEGSEHGILLGGQRFFATHRPVLVTEAASKHLRRAGSSLPDLHGLLQTMGYHCFQIGRFGLSLPDLSPHAKSANWCCLPKERLELRRHISFSILKCGLLPRFLNPLAKHRSRRP